MYFSNCIKYLDVNNHKRDNKPEVINTENIDLKINFAVPVLNKVTILLNNHIIIKSILINTKTIKMKVKIKVPRTNPRTIIIPASIKKIILVKIFIKITYKMYIS